MRKLYFFLFLFACQLLIAQNESVQLSVQLKNGDVITGISELRTVSFKTDFGTLNFPIDEINSIEVGLKDSRFDKGNLLNLIEKVANGSSKEKEQAFDEIIKMDEGAIPFIKAYLNSSKSYDISSENDISVQTLYEVMLAKYKVSRNYSLNDIITYNNEFRVEGSYEFSNITINTDYGLIRIERNDISRIDVKLVQDELSSRNSFKLFASQHITGNKEEGWLNTGILVKKGEKLTIKANGQIILASLSGNTYSPDGGVNGSVGAEKGGLSYGQVVYKIGQGGKEQKAGNSLNIYANETGIIYLSIYESVYNSANAGYYTVDVKVN